MELPSNLKYAESHEWIAEHADGTATVGISALAAEQLGDLVYVELPETGRRVARGEACAIVESSKAASDVYAPAAGEVIETNPALKDNPGAVNASPYRDGWLFRLRIDAPAEGLLERDAYARAHGVEAA
ncbi:MAG TPA: glycine cleavage system protein GcvH [Burkholderiales bacterium]|nr:glycine cleavage system protein GcvH [Burkholderiales bacterium]